MGEFRLRWTRDDCGDAMARFLAQAPAGSRATQRAYADWAREQPEPVPYPSAINRHGGLGEIRAEAERRRGGRGTPPSTAISR